LHEVLIHISLACRILECFTFNHFFFSRLFIVNPNHRRRDVVVLLVSVLSIDGKEDFFKSSDGNTIAFDF
jgi:hypothetical protein